MSLSFMKRETKYRKKVCSGWSLLTRGVILLVLFRSRRCSPRWTRLVTVSSLRSSGCRSSRLLAVRHRCKFVPDTALDWSDMSLYREEVSSFFLEMDRDYDGKLSFSEFMGEETPLEQLFRSMDREGNGSITKHVSFSSIFILYIVLAW